MKVHTRSTIAIFGGAAALALTVGFGGLGVNPAGDASTTTHSSSSVAPARPGPAAPGGGTSVHMATLTGCIAGANC